MQMYVISSDFRMFLYCFINALLNYFAQLQSSLSFSRARMAMFLIQSRSFIKNLWQSLASCAHE